MDCKVVNEARITNLTLSNVSCSKNTLETTGQLWYIQLFGVGPLQHAWKYTYVIYVYLVYARASTSFPQRQQLFRQDHRYVCTTLCEHKMTKHLYRLYRIKLYIESIYSYIDSLYRIYIVFCFICHVTLQLITLSVVACSFSWAIGVPGSGASRTRFKCIAWALGISAEEQQKNCCSTSKHSELHSELRSAKWGLGVAFLYPDGILFIWGFSGSTASNSAATLRIWHAEPTSPDSRSGLMTNVDLLRASLFFSFHLRSNINPLSPKHVVD